MGSSATAAASGSSITWTSITGSRVALTNFFAKAGDSEIPLVRGGWCDRGQHAVSWEGVVGIPRWSGGQWGPHLFRRCQPNGHGASALSERGSSARSAGARMDQATRALESAVWSAVDGIATDE